MVDSGIEEFRKRTKVLSVLEDPRAPLADRAEAIRSVMLEKPEFWIEIARRTASKQTSAPVSAQPTVDPKTETAPAAKQETTPAKPAVPVTAPARTLTPESESNFILWVQLLKDATKDQKTPWKDLQVLTTKVFRSEVKLSQYHWKLLFAAVKMADQRGSHVINNDAGPAKIFAMAPVELVDDLLFGQDGILRSLTREIRGIRGKTPIWLYTRASIVLDAIAVVDENPGLDDQEDKQADDFFEALRSKNVPDWLATKAKMILGCGEEAPLVIEFKEPPVLVDPNWRGNGQLGEALKAVVAN